MNKTLLLTAGILGFLGVALGAFGAHLLENRLSEKMIETYRTGVLYHLIHSAVLLAIALTGNPRFNTAGYLFTAGILLFSFSLYAYALTGIKFFAMITPVGGLLFLAAWGIVIFAGLKS